MPPRWVCAAVVVAWVAASAWLFRREVWQHFERDAPPPFAIDLIEETQSEKTPLRWRVERNGSPAFVARTSVSHRPKENDFTLHALFEPINEMAGGNEKFPRIRIERMASSYRVTPEGQLLGLDVKMAGDFQRDEAKAAVPFEVRVWGDVRGGMFAPHVELTSDLWPSAGARFAPPPVAVSAQGAVLMPLHPINRLSGLRPGQRWRVPVVDPLASLTGGDGSVRFLRAAVRPKAETRRWGGADVSCLVVDYDGGSSGDEKISASTWVREADGLVLRQEAEVSGEKWVMQRE
jgi:hypothetical protein